MTTVNSWKTLRVQSCLLFCTRCSVDFSLTLRKNPNLTCCGSSARTISNNASAPFPRDLHNISTWSAPAWLLPLERRSQSLIGQRRAWPTQSTTANALHSQTSNSATSSQRKGPRSSAGQSKSNLQLDITAAHPSIA